MINRLKNIIKTGINRGIDDSKNFQRGLYSWLGRDIPQKVVVFTPYGTFGCPQDGLPAILLSSRAQESNIMALVADPINRIKKDCKKGEYGIGNPLTKANIYFKEDGNMVIEIPSGNIVATASEINLNNGSDGVARLNDTTMSNATSDPQFWAWLSASATVLAGLGVVAPIPTALTSKINSASTTVKAG